MSIFDLDFQIISFEYVESSRRLSRAASLCQGDPIKQEMVAFIEPYFAKNVARAEGLRLLVEQDYEKHREFILSEMQEITQKNIEMAEQITRKIGGLNTDELLN